MSGQNAQRAENFDSLNNRLDSILDALNALAEPTSTSEPRSRPLQAVPDLDDSVAQPNLTDPPADSLTPLATPTAATDAAQVDVDIPAPELPAPFESQLDVLEASSGQATPNVEAPLSSDRPELTVVSDLDSPAFDTPGLPDLPEILEPPTFAPLEQVLDAPVAFDEPPVFEVPPVPEAPVVSEDSVFEVPPVPEAPVVEVPPVPETPAVSEAPVFEVPPVPEAPVVEVPPVPETPAVSEAPVVEVPPVPEAAETPDVSRPFVFEVPPVPEVAEASAFGVADRVSEPTDAVTFDNTVAEAAAPEVSSPIESVFGTATSTPEQAEPSTEVAAATTEDVERPRSIFRTTSDAPSAPEPVQPAPESDDDDWVSHHITEPTREHGLFDEVPSASAAPTAPTQLEGDALWHVDHYPEAPEVASVEPVAQEREDLWSTVAETEEMLFSLDPAVEASEGSDIFGGVQNFAEVEQPVVSDLPMPAGLTDELATDDSVKYGTDEDLPIPDFTGVYDETPKDWTVPGGDLVASEETSITQTTAMMRRDELDRLRPSAEVAVEAQETATQARQPRIVLLGVIFALVALAVIFRDQLLGFI